MCTRDIHPRRRGDFEDHFQSQQNPQESGAPVVDFFGSVGAVVISYYNEGREKTRKGRGDEREIGWPEDGLIRWVPEIFAVDGDVQGLVVLGQRERH